LLKQLKKVLSYCCDGVPLKFKKKNDRLQFTSTDSLSIVLTPLKIRWTIPLTVLKGTNANDFYLKFITLKCKNPHYFDIICCFLSYIKKWNRLQQIFYLSKKDSLLTTTPYVTGKNPNIDTNYLRADYSFLQVAINLKIPIEKHTHCRRNCSFGRP
jgi:hypothetical protein